MRSLSLATLIAALSGFVVIWIATWALDPSAAASFQAYWGLFFALTGVLDGIMLETTRATAAVRSGTVGPREPLGPVVGTRVDRKGPATQSSSLRRHGRGYPWTFASMTATVTFVLAGSIGWVFLPLVLGDQHRGIGTLVLGLGLASYTYQATLAGVLSGHKRWNRYALLISLDAILRVAIAGIAWFKGLGLLAFILVTVAGALSWTVLFAGATHADLDVTKSVYRRRVYATMLASGSSAAMITGFPVLVQATFHGEAGVAAVILAVTLTRAPILVPLHRFQSAFTVRFVDSGRSVFRALVVPVGSVLGVGAVGAAAAGLLGPWILELLYDPNYAMPGSVLALLTFASALMGAIMITGAATLARGGHPWYVAGWVTATLVSFFLLLVSDTLIPAVVTALLVGPLVGILVHLLGLSRHHRLSD